MCHDTTKPFLLKAASKVVRSKEFDEKCVYRQNILKVYGPKPSEVSEQDKEKEEAKAAEILDSLVSKESVGNILAVNPTKNPAGIQKQSAQANQPAPNTPQQGANLQGPVLPQDYNGLQSSQNSPLKEGPLVAKRLYQPKPRVNSYDSAFPRMGYVNALRRKGFSPKPFSQGSQSVYTRYRPRISGKPLQISSSYGMTYSRTPHHLVQYIGTPGSYGIRNAWQRPQPPFYRGIDLRGGPGSMRPGHVLHMARKPPSSTVVQESKGRFQNPLKTRIQGLPKAPVYSVTSANKPQQYTPRQQAGPIRAANQMTSPKPQPISKTNPPKMKTIVWGEPVTSQRSKPISTKSGSAVYSGSGSGEMAVAKHREPKPIDPKRAVYSTGGKDMIVV